MRSLKHLSQQLEALESISLDNPDQLFAISYLRGHTDLLLARDESAQEDHLRDALAHGFQTDSMSEQDKTLILDLLGSSLLNN